jgi:hypothetical protein
MRTNLLFFLLLGAYTRAAFAFCPSYPTLVEEFNESDAIIVGIVTGEEHVPDTEATFYAGTLYFLKVERLIKGTQKLELRLFSENTTARFPMEIGKSYLVFARRDTDLFKNTNTYWVNSCGNSKPAGHATKELRKLRTMK